MLRICFTAEEFFPLPSGRLRRIYEVGKRLALRNEVHIYCQMYPGAPREEEVSGIHVHRVGPPVLKASSYLRRALSVPYLFKSLLKSGDFDIINTNWLFPPLPSYLAARLRGVRIVLTSDGILWHHLCGLNLPGYGLLPKVFGCMVEDVDVKLNYDAYITVSRGTKEELISMGVDPEKVFVVYNGVDIQFYDSIDVEESHEPSVCYVGHLEGRKNAFDLIKAFSIVLKSIPDARLTIAGSGPLMGRARDLAEALKLGSKVKFLGSVGFKEAARVMKSSHLLVLPSLVEGFGIVLAEANACRKPAVAYDVPNVREVIKDGVNGFLVKPRDVSMLALRIIELLKDDRMRRRMGENGRMIVERNFTWDRAAEETLKVYKRIIGDA
ncbi:hypothetical protein DRO55_03355 [Candidatus Bathyarchaeota archaeon]|nr:MAG: hypothetical protein DRO55_03355 [Candidatus Bathyarchaeota archaeon]